MEYLYGDHIPIFISVHNKVEQLKTVIKSYEDNIKTPIKIILFNHNTTYEPCLKYLKEMEEKGYIIYEHFDTNPRDRKYGDLIRKSRNTNLMNKIKDYLSKNLNVNYFVVTDTDIELLPNTGDILDIYVNYYQKFKNIEVPIGTSIKISDVSKSFHQYDRMLRSELPHWEKSKESILELNNKQIKCYKTPIDTTFKLYHKKWLDIPRDTLFSHVAYRTDLPYQTKHLDWYVNKKSATPELIYYSKTSRQSHYRV